MNSSSFNGDELYKCDWQYQIRLDNLSHFKKGDKVFLTCCPEYPLIVLGSIANTVIVNDIKSGDYYEYPPACLQKYEFASLMIWRDKYPVCFN